MSIEVERRPSEEYHKLAGFEHVYLEDSFVSGISLSSQELRFDVELVLLEAHPRHERPPKGVYHCYRNAQIIFSEIESIESFRLMKGYNNLEDGILNYGNIYSMSAQHAQQRYFNTRYQINGDWGELDIISKSPYIQFIESSI